MLRAPVSAAIRQSRQVVAPQRRTMAGGFPADWKIKQNIFYEEWNGKREITEKTFKIGLKDLPTLAFFIAFPVFIYATCRQELKMRDPRRFKNTC